MSIVTEILESAQGGKLIENIAQDFGLSWEQAQNAVTALTPALALGLQNAAKNPEVMEKVITGLVHPSHQGAFDDPAVAHSAEANEAGQAVVAHLFGSGSAAGELAQIAARSAGLRPDLMGQLLQVIASVVMGGLFKSFQAQGLGSILAKLAGADALGTILGQLGGAAAAPQQPRQSGGSFGGLLGGLLGTLFGGGQTQLAMPFPAGASALPLPQGLDASTVQSTLNQIIKSLGSGGGGQNAELEGVLNKVFPKDDGGAVIPKFPEKIFKTDIENPGRDPDNYSEKLSSETKGEKALADQNEKSERILVVTGSLPLDPEAKPIEKFKENSAYKLRIRIAGPIPEGNLTVGLVDIPEQPKGGLPTRWILSSTTVEFLAISTAGPVTKRGEAYFAEFDMLIPEKGDSPTIDLLVRTIEVPGVIDITVLAFGEEYRKATVRLDSECQLMTDVVSTKSEHLNLGTTHEWTTPSEHFKLTVFGQKAYVTTVGVARDNPGWFDWRASKSGLDGPIKRVRRALDAYRVAAGELLNALDFEDMERRLQSRAWMVYPSNWHLADDPAREPKPPSCGDAEQLRLLADAGYSLYDSCFPTDSKLRDFVEGLKPGSRLDFIWTAGGGDWVSHVPWALMYMTPVPPGAVVECGHFFGLRFRIEGKAWETQTPSAALGDPGKVNAQNLLYWGDPNKDEVAAQSSWQREVFGKWDRQFFVPADPALDRKEQVVRALATPNPSPTGILYLYCQCAVGDGSEPDLQFSDDPTKSNIVTAGEIYQGPLAGNPLVFINACMSAKAEPQGASELEQRFFRRNIRAFIGTEEKVPSVFASRFAWLFFQFFLRKADPEHHPMAAGEALTQARLFLWTQYQNPGGLFYCLVNRYDLFFADDAEVAALQRHR